MVVIDTPTDGRYMLPAEAVLYIQQETGSVTVRFSHCILGLSIYLRSMGFIDTGRFVNGVSWCWVPVVPSSSCGRTWSYWLLTREQE